MSSAQPRTLAGRRSTAACTAPHAHWLVGPAAGGRHSAAVWRRPAEAVGRVRRPRPMCCPAAPSASSVLCVRQAVFSRFTRPMWKAGRETDAEVPLDAAPPDTHDQPALAELPCWLEPRRWSVVRPSGGVGAACRAAVAAARAVCVLLTLHTSAALSVRWQLRPRWRIRGSSRVLAA